MAVVRSTKRVIKYGDVYTASVEICLPLGYIK